MHDCNFDVAPAAFNTSPFYLSPPERGKILIYDMYLSVLDTHYGTIAGKVTSILHDAVKDDKLGLIYPARVRLSKHVIVADGKSIQLEPGMASSVEIKTEQRRIIEYLLTPLLKYRNEALKER